MTSAGVPRAASATASSAAAPASSSASRGRPSRKPARSIARPRQAAPPATPIVKQLAVSAPRPPGSISTSPSGAMFPGSRASVAAAAHRHQAPIRTNASRCRGAPGGPAATPAPPVADSSIPSQVARNLRPRPSRWPGPELGGITTLRVICPVLGFTPALRSLASTLRGSALMGDGHRTRGISRRGFLRGMGVSAAAGGAALGAGPALGAPAAPEAAPAATSPDRFGRMFPGLPAFAPENERVTNALLDIGHFGGMLDAKDPIGRPPAELITDPAASVNNRDNPTHTAGTTFLGQFLDHDMTFDTSSRLGHATVPEQSPNARTPRLDLDSVYGRGPTLDPLLYDPADPVKFRVESGGLFEDVPRDSSGRAILADPRNDENL